MFGRCGDGMNLDIQFTEQTKSFDVEMAEKPILFNSPFGEVYIVGDSDNTQMYLLVTEDGQELPAVMVEELTLFDATPNDIRKGKTAATESGVTVGEKVIPTYHTHYGNKVITKGKPFNITATNYDYTKLQAFICRYNSNLNNSVATEKVVLNDNVFEVGSVDSISMVTKNHSTGTIELGITNNTDKPQILRFFYFKEIY